MQRKFVRIWERFFMKKENPGVLPPLRPELEEIVRGDIALVTLFQMAKRQNTDLMEAEYPQPASEKEAVYRGRIYSISGKHPSFPELPAEILYMGMLLMPFREGKSKPRRCPAKQAVSYSRRPWADDRSQEEKEAYERKFAIRAKRDYEWLREHMPEEAPDTYEGFARLKKTDPKGYYALDLAARKVRNQEEG